MVGDLIKDVYFSELEFFTVLHVFLPESAGIRSIPVDSGNSAEWNFSSTAC